MLLVGASIFGLFCVRLNFERELSVEVGSVHLVIDE